MPCFFAPVAAFAATHPFVAGYIATAAVAGAALGGARFGVIDASFPEDDEPNYVFAPNLMTGGAIMGACAGPFLAPFVVPGLLASWYVLRK